MADSWAQLCGASAATPAIAVASPRRSKVLLGLPRSLGLFLLLAVVSTFGGFLAARHNIFGASWPNSFSRHATSSLSSAHVLLSASDAQPKTGEAEELTQLTQLPPQQQAERLLELAIRRPDPSLGLIRKNLDSWRGRLESNDKLFHLVLAALKADDPRVRTAAVEIDLAANHIEKSPHSVAQLRHQIQNGTDGRFLALWRLGALGNRGVEPSTVLSTLLHYSRDANQQTRFWAAEGLAMLGTEKSIDPLLSILTNDPAPSVRESAACGLGRSGLLTGEQRLTAVPQLLNFLDDDALDSATRDLVYAVLQSITGASFGKNPNAWREWWAHHDRPEKPHSTPKALLFA